MRITDNLYITFNNPKVEFTLGVHHEMMMFIQENEEEDDIEFVPMYKLILGFLVFNITILY